jgi:exosortase
MLKSSKGRIVIFSAIIACSAILSSAFFRELLEFSLKNSFSSHVLLIPLLSVMLIIYRKADIFSDVRYSIFGGGIFSLIGAALLAWSNFGNTGLIESDLLSAKAFAIMIFWMGVFLLFFGCKSLRNAIFPLLFLLFMIPIPKALLETVVSALQRGSAEMTALLFRITGTPHYRNDLTFVLPRISIEIAEQCSGIRSSLALLITSLLAAHLMLRTFWHKAILVAFAVPLAMLKNAIRITVLSLLSVHIDTRFLRNSDLHQEGGILFYVLALVLMLPILSLLRRSERKADKDRRRQSAAIKA